MRPLRCSCCCAACRCCDTLLKLTHRAAVQQAPSSLCTSHVSRQLLQHLAKRVAMVRSRFPHIFWRETAPQHYATPSGEFVGDGSLGSLPYTCRAIPDVELLTDGRLQVRFSILTSCGFGLGSAAQPAVQGRLPMATLS